MTEEPRPRRIEWNLNTILSGLGLVTMITGGGYLINDQQRDIREIKEWRVELEGDLKDRRGEVERQFGSISAKAGAQDEAIRTAQALANQNAYRIAGLETRGERLDAQLSDLARQLNDQSGDLKVIREILTRLEVAQRAEDTGRSASASSRR